MDKTAYWYTEDPPVPLQPPGSKRIDRLLFLNIVMGLFLTGILLYAGELSFTDEPPFVEITLYDKTPIRDNTITISQSSITELRAMWNTAMETGLEQGRCLEITNNVISNVQTASTSDHQPESLKFTKPCKQASIHTHDNGVCRLSPRDAIYFFQSENEYIAVMCDEDKFGIYDMDELQKSYQVVTG